MHEIVSSRHLELPRIVNASPVIYSDPLVSLVSKDSVNAVVRCHLETVFARPTSRVPQRIAVILKTTEPCPLSLRILRWVKPARRSS
jgi:hypothetical protein